MVTILDVTGGGHVHFGPAVRTIIEYSRKRGWRVFGSRYGWKGVKDAYERVPGGIVDITDIPDSEMRKMDYVGASPTFSSRTKLKFDWKSFVRDKFGVTHTIGHGGDDTLRMEPDVAWPKTMDDNHGPQSDSDDLAPGTYFCIGYPTAVFRAGQEVLAAHANAQTNSSVHGVVLFGRNQDFVALGAAAFGCADLVVPGERKSTFEDFYQRLQAARFRNAERYGCNPFAVYVMPEGLNAGDAVGFFGEFAPAELREFAKNHTEVDAFGHPKLDPEIVYEMARNAILRRAGDEIGERKITKSTGRAVTYWLRDGQGIATDQRMGRATALECMRMIEDGDLGKMAVVKWDPARNDFITGRVPIADALQERYAHKTGFFDDELWLPTKKFVRHASRFMGNPPEKDDFVFDGHAYKPVAPIA